MNFEQITKKPFTDLNLQMEKPLNKHQSHNVIQKAVFNGLGHSVEFIATGLGHPDTSRAAGPDRSITIHKANTLDDVNKLIFLSLLTSHDYLLALLSILETVGHESSTLYSDLNHIIDEYDACDETRSLDVTVDEVKMAMFIIEFLTEPNDDMLLYPVHTVVKDGILIDMKVPDDAADAKCYAKELIFDKLDKMYAIQYHEFDSMFYLNAEFSNHVQLEASDMSYINGVLLIK